MEKLYIDDLPDSERDMILSVFNIISDIEYMMKMISNNHTRDMRFANSIRIPYQNPSEHTVYPISFKQRQWFELIAKRITRGFYEYPNINFLVDPPEILVERFADISYAGMIEQDEDETAANNDKEKEDRLARIYANIDAAKINYQVKKEDNFNNEEQE